MHKFIAHLLMVIAVGSIFVIIIEKAFPGAQLSILIWLIDEAILLAD